MNVRTAQPGDETSIALLLSQLGYPTSPDQMRLRLARIEQRGGITSLVAVEAEQVIGFAAVERFASFSDDQPVGRVVVMVVDEQRRGEGIGSALLAACESVLIAAGAERIVLTSAHRRAGAHRFYERHGYASTGLRFAKLVGPAR